MAASANKYSVPPWAIVIYTYILPPRGKTYEFHGVRLHVLNIYVLCNTLLCRSTYLININRVTKFINFKIWKCHKIYVQKYFETSLEMHI